VLKGICAKFTASRRSFKSFYPNCALSLMRRSQKSESPRRDQSPNCTKTMRRRAGEGRMLNRAAIRRRRLAEIEHQRGEGRCAGRYRILMNRIGANPIHQSTVEHRVAAAFADGKWRGVTEMATAAGLTTRQIASAIQQIEQKRLASVARRRDGFDSRARQYRIVRLKPGDKMVTLL